jgi:cob(I)alamin adenosyltransferase
MQAEIESINRIVLLLNAEITYNTYDISIEKIADDIQRWVGIRKKFISIMEDISTYKIDEQNEFIVNNICVEAHNRELLKLIEDFTNYWNKSAPTLTNFIAPSFDIIGAQINFERTQARKIEREYVGICSRWNRTDATEIIPELKPVFNRMSSCFFAFMRAFEYKYLHKTENYFNNWSDNYINEMPPQMPAPIIEGLPKTVIYTKQGDKGTTDANVPSKVLKCSTNIHLVGLLDELQAQLGVEIAKIIKAKNSDSYKFKSWIYSWIYNAPTPKLENILYYINYQIYLCQGVIAGAPHTKVDNTIWNTKKYETYDDILKFINIDVPNKIMIADYINKILRAIRNIALEDFIIRDINNIINNIKLLTN